MTSNRLEFVITVHDPKVWDTSLWDELTKDGLGDNYIPKRAVVVINERPFNDYSAHFALTRAEAAEIRKDPRIRSVELVAHLQDDVHKEMVSFPGWPGDHDGDHDGDGQDGPDVVDYEKNPRLQTRNVRRGLFDKQTYSINNQMRNWALLRCTNLRDNPFWNSQSVEGEYTYSLDGEGVDIVVIDSGVEANHPEFARNPDGTGGSRVIEFDWSSLGVNGTPKGWEIGGYLGDSDGHGSHCASTIAGTLNGWAPKAEIYPLRIFSGVDITTGSYLGEIPVDLAFDLVRAFHLKKVASGNRRPTVCSNSWGYTTTYWGMNGTVFRGTLYNNTSPNPNLGQVYYRHPYRVDYVDVAVENCAAAGVILVGAAGNYYHKVDVPGGDDYDNYYYYYSWWGDIETVYYHRGMSPASAPSMICVGAVDDTIQERKVDFSESGPRVDIYAPGVAIMAAFANEFYATPAVPDPRDDRYFLNKLQGTSMACPQVAGVVACLMQMRPELNIYEVKRFLWRHAIKDQLDEGLENTYTNFHNLHGGANHILGFPYASAKRGSVNVPVRSYWLAADNYNLFEDEHVTITLTTENVAPGTRIPYVIEAVTSGFTVEDLRWPVPGSEPIVASEYIPAERGEFVVGEDGSDSFTMVAIDERDAEGTEYFRVRLLEPREYLDNTGEISVEISIGDPPPIWDLVVPGGETSIREGQSVDVIIRTVNVTAGTLVDWEIYGGGITESDFDSPPLLTGQSIIETFPGRPDDDGATVTFTPTVDFDFGDYESFTFRLLTPAPNLAVSFDIIDRTPIITVTADRILVDEGETINFAVDTYRIDDEGLLFWSLSSPTISPEDFIEGATEGAVVVHSYGPVENETGEASIQLNVKEDELTESTLETRDIAEQFTLRIHTNSPSGPIWAESELITIRDSSRTPPVFDVIPNVTTLTEESDTVEFVITSVGADDGSIFFWSLDGEGIDAGDFVGAASGTITTVGNLGGSVTVTINRDKFTEGEESFVMNIRGGSVTGRIFGTSVPVTIMDTSKTPTYTIVPTSTAVDEGSDLTFTVNTTDVDDGTTIYYRLVGAATEDFFGPTATGSFVVNSAMGTFTISTVEDFTTEGEEIFVVELSTTEGGATVATSDPVVINDTSRSPTYDVTASAEVIDEGDSVTFTVNTTFVINNTTLYYSLTGDAGDYVGSLDGSFVITGDVTAGTGSFTVTTRKDYTTEGEESFVAYIRTSPSGENKASSPLITVNDTSLSPTYAITPDVTTVDETGSIVFTVNTTFVPNNTTLYYGVAGIDAADCASGSHEGSFVITGDDSAGTGTFTVTLRKDYTTEGTETFKAQVKESPTGAVVAESTDITVSDSSLTPTFTIVPDALSVNEGGSILFTINTTDVDDGTQLYFNVNGPQAADWFGGSLPSGDFTVNSGVGTVSIMVVEDYTTEGAETFTLSVSTTPGGVAVATSPEITINDTSLSSTYSIVPIVTSVNEGAAVVFTVTTTFVPDGTTLYWTTTGVTGTVDAADFTDAAVSGSVVINGGTATITRTLSNDVTTEGAEAFALELRTGSAAGPIVATSSTVDVADTSQMPVVYATANNTEAYEGGSIRFNITTENVPNGTVLYWTLSGITSADIQGAATQGTRVINNNTTGGLTLFLTADGITETESMTFDVHTGSHTGPIVATITVPMVDA